MVSRNTPRRSESREMRTCVARYLYTSRYNCNICVNIYIYMYIDIHIYVYVYIHVRIPTNDLDHYRMSLNREIHVGVA